MTDETSTTAAVATVYYCNYNCICTKTVCENKHYFTNIADRKFASVTYNMIPDIRDHIKEENPETRKINCFYGQLCTKKDCGFRHFLSPEGREIFNIAIGIREES